MTLKKILRKESLSSSSFDLVGGSAGRSSLGNDIAQASLEYFILLAIIAILTILSFSTFFLEFKGSAQGKNGFFCKAAERIIE